MPFSLTASAMGVTGFQYTGNVTITTGTGPVQAMEFVASTTATTNLGLSISCAPSHLKLTVSMTTSLQATAGTVVIDATQFAATTNGTAVDWTVVSPPPTHPFAGDSGTLTAVTVTTVAMSAGSLAVPGYATSASFC